MSYVAVHACYTAKCSYTHKKLGALDTGTDPEIN